MGNGPTRFELTAFLRSLTAELQDLAAGNLLPPDAFNSVAWNTGSKLHARVFGALVRAVQRPLIPAVEVAWGRNWCPDLCIVDEADTICAVIEYESTNSSDERMFAKDLVHFERSITGLLGKAEPVPAWWVLISTLPDHAVSGWKWYPYNLSMEFPPSSKSNKLRMENPLRYYEDGLHEYLSTCWKRLTHISRDSQSYNIAWVNLRGVDKIDVKNVNGSPTKRALQ